MHGGVRPSWQQGSSETYRVAPGGVLGAAASSAIALGVRLAGRLGDALADHALVLDHDGAHERVRARLPARPRGELDGPLKVARVALCGRGLWHSRGTFRAGLTRESTIPVGFLAQP